MKKVPTYAGSLVDRRFTGIVDSPACAKCGYRMDVTRRTPHPTYGISCELQSFECAGCGLTMCRSVDAVGAPHAGSPFGG
jgi:hypothetical protein